jgi:hypothetical protein
MQAQPETPSARYTVVYYGASQMGKFKLIAALQKYLPAELIRAEVTVDGSAPPQLSFSCGLARLPRGVPPVTLTLKTIAGPVLDRRDWNPLIQEADAVVVVAEASKVRLEDNVKSIDYLAHVLGTQGRDPRRFPLALLYYRRDLPSDAEDAVELPADLLDEQLRPLEWPRFEATGAPGPTLTAPLYALYELLRKPHALPDPDDAAEPEPPQGWWARLRRRSPARS